MKGTPTAPTIGSLGANSDGLLTRNRALTVSNEEALAKYYEDTPERWENVAREIRGGKSVQVQRHYQILLRDLSHIESGRVPILNYKSLPRLLAVYIFFCNVVLMLVCFFVVCINSKAFEASEVELIGGRGHEFSAAIYLVSLEKIITVIGYHMLQTL
ncbi:uncharacterized protein LOC129286069 [Prosopis cineraria]|uniref:uncharacterized protein LOC129286069 n=1 Tax=Prosopis cineraria TaxID=364024 RepID=UPI00241059CB|nr:uncharacterized protein LOC129286069 [Prosopis cineraria]